MRVVIAGGHGKIALLLERLLAERGDQAAGLIRNPDHIADVRKAGAEAVVCDLEAASADDVAVLLSGADAVVFAAGAGPGSGVPRKDSVDRGGSVLMADAAGRAQHFLITAPRQLVFPVAVAWAAWELRSIGRSGENLVIRRRWPTGCSVT